MRNYPIKLSLGLIAFILATCGPTTNPNSTEALSTNTPAQSPIPSATSTFVPTPTFTPTFLPPMAVVGGLVPCYEEPGTQFSQVVALDATMQVTIEGKNESEEFLMVTLPEIDRVCWIEAKYATLVSGEIPQLAVIVPTATPTPLAPNGVENFKGYGDCQPMFKPGRRTYDKFTISMILTWDGTPEAEGYRIYKDYQLLQVINGDQTKFIDSWLEEKKAVSRLFTYGIQGFNSSGDSEIVSIPVSFSCNP